MRTAFGILAMAALALPLAPAAAQTGSRAADVQAVQAVLAQYKAAIEKLDAKGTERLFTSDSQIFETGGSEGSYANYLSHHLGPELAEFKSFKFSDYEGKRQVRRAGGARNRDLPIQNRAENRRGG